MEKRTLAVSVVSLGLVFGLVIAVALAQNAPAGQRGPAAAPTPPCGPNLSADIKNVAKDSRCFELRTYTVREGKVHSICCIPAFAITRPRCSRSMACRSSATGNLSESATH